MGATEASAGQIQHYPILSRHSLGKINSCAVQDGKKEPGMRFSTSDVLHEIPIPIPIPPLQVRTHHVTEAAFKYLVFFSVIQAWVALLHIVHLR